MRYEGNCESWIKNNRTTLSETLVDDVVFIAGCEKIDTEEQIEKLHKDRYGLVFINKKAELEIKFKAEFDKSITDEKALLKKLQEYQSLFSKLNPLFEKIQIEFPRLMAPNLKEVKVLIKDHVHLKLQMKGRLNDELASSLKSSHNIGKTVDEISSDPAWLAKKKEINGIIVETENKIAKLTEYVNTINKIFLENKDRSE